MGCDIHVYTEMRVAGGWDLVLPTREQYRAQLGLVFDKDKDDNFLDSQINWRYEDSGEVKVDEDGRPYSSEWLVWRNYRLFWILSGVRGEEWRNMHQVCMPDLPLDVSSAVATEWAAWGMDAHSPGWLTLKEAHDERLVHADRASWPLLLRQWDRMVGNDLDALRIVLWYDN